MAFIIGRQLGGTVGSLPWAPVVHEPQCGEAITVSPARLPRERPPKPPALPLSTCSYHRIRGLVLERDPTGGGRATAIRAAAIALCARNAAGAPPPLALPLKLIKQLVPTAADDSAASVPRVDGDALWAPLEGMRVSLEYPLTVVSAERYEEHGGFVAGRRICHNICWMDGIPIL